MPNGAQDKITVTSPCDGSVIAELICDNGQTLAYKIKQAKAAQEKWQKLPRAAREKLLVSFSEAVAAKKDKLTEVIVYDAGKTFLDAGNEVAGAADIIKKTIENASLPEFNRMLRVKERPPVGVVGLITSFNFPISVAHWNIAPALLAGNAVIWKPSEKTPMVAIAIKEIFDAVAGEFKELVQVIIGGREIGSRLVSHEQVDMVSATGSVAMGQGIKAALAQKENNSIAPILELGGNNGVIISDKTTSEHRKWAVSCLLNSFLGTSGQRCTNTRRLIVQRNVYDEVVAEFTAAIKKFLESGTIINPVAENKNEYGYGVLIDEDSFQRFENSKKQAVIEGGKIVFGARMFKERTRIFYVEPTLALMPEQSHVMFKETFAPLLFIAPYNDFTQAVAMLNAPDNGGLVGAIYTQNKEEAEIFARENEAGHSLINPPKGTGTPAHGMGFGGNKESGEGEILNSADPLQPFTRRDRFSRIAMNVNIKMDI